jgi:hypothetical protein
VGIFDLICGAENVSCLSRILPASSGQCARRARVASSPGSRSIPSDVGIAIGMHRNSPGGHSRRVSAIVGNCGHREHRHSASTAFALAAAYAPTTATRPPSSVMNCLRFTRSPRRRGRAASQLPQCRALSPSPIRTLVGACTGRSAGFSPLKMRSTYPAACRS